MPMASAISPIGFSVARRAISSALGIGICASLGYYWSPEAQVDLVPPLRTMSRTPKILCADLYCPRAPKSPAPICPSRQRGFGEDPDRGCLACAVRSQQAEHRAGADREV